MGSSRKGSGSDDAGQSSENSSLINAALKEHESDGSPKRPERESRLTRSTSREEVAIPGVDEPKSLRAKRSGAAPSGGAPNIVPPASPNPVPAAPDPARNALLANRPELAAFLQKYNALNFINAPKSLLSMVNENKIRQQLTKITGVSFDKDKATPEDNLALSAIRNEAMRVNACNLFDLFAGLSEDDFKFFTKQLASSKTQRTYRDEHNAMMMANKQLQEDLKLLEKKSALANTLMRQSYDAIYAIDKEAAAEKLAKIQATAYALAEKLIVLEANCKLREELYHSENSKNKMKTHIESIGYLLSQLEDVHTNVKAAKSAAMIEKSKTHTTHQGVSAKRYRTIEEAQKAANAKTDSHIGGLSAGYQADKIVDYKNKAERERINAQRQFDVIKRQIKLSDDQSLDAASIQYQTGDDAHPGYRQDSIMSDEVRETMGAREGFPPNRIPGKHVMEWAIQEITDFHQQIDKGKDTPTIFIHADGYHPNQVEAMILVCMARNLKHSVMNGNPVKVKEKDLQKRLEKAKAHPEYGVKLKSAAELAATVEQVTTPSLGRNLRNQ